MVFWLALSAVSAPALAGTIPTRRPAQCTAQLTVQMRGCRVDHIYTCPDDQVWTESYEAAEQLVTLTTSDGDLIWQGSKGEGVLATNSKPAFSIHRAMTDGAYSFSIPLEFHIMGGTQVTDSHGTVTPLPGTVTISGLIFHRFDVYQEAQLKPPGPLLTTHDVNYYDPDLGFVIFGESKTTAGDTKQDYNWVPVVITKPGEKGFLSPEPAYGCGELSLNFTDEKAEHS